MPRLRRPGTFTAFGIAAILVAVGCGGDDSGSSSDSTTTTSTPTSTTSADTAAIETLQQELDTLGCGAGNVDGILGPETEAAIKHFQTAAGLTVDGIVGTQTRAALAAAASSGTPHCEDTPPPSSSATTTTTGGSGPPCEADLINAAVAASLESGTVVEQTGEFECSGDFAVVEPSVSGAGGSGGATITVLLKWSGTAWQAVDRATYCASGQVPSNISTLACDSN
jgi:hypothetical protein